MAAITGTFNKATEFAGDYKLVIVDIVPESASDTVTLNAATHGITEILAVFPQLLTGQDAALTAIFATFSGLVITVTNHEQDGTPGTDWTSATGRLLVLGRSGT